MKEGGQITEFGKLLRQSQKKAQPVQTQWVVVKSVDWNEKTMTATGVVDDLDFFGVLLGLGNFYRKPTIGSKCLIGIVNNDDAATFLIECESCDEIEISDQTGFKVHLNGGFLTLNGSQHGGLIKINELRTQLAKETAVLHQIQSVFQNWVPIPNDGGASLKALVTAFTGMPLADLTNIENNKIKHG